jgi:hypothetical protein
MPRAGGEPVLICGSHPLRGAVVPEHVDGWRAHTRQRRHSTGAGRPTAHHCDAAGGVVHPDSASGCVQDILLCTTVTSAIATTAGATQQQAQVCQGGVDYDSRPQNPHEGGRCGSWLLLADFWGVGGLQPRVARPKSTDSCCFQGVVGVNRQAEFWSSRLDFRGVCGPRK